MVMVIVIGAFLILATSIALSLVMWEARLAAAREQDKADLMRSLGIAEEGEVAGGQGWLSGKLEAAGVSARPARFVACVCIAAAGAAMVAAALAGAAIGALAGAAVLAGSYLHLVRRASKRVGDFEEQLGFFLPMVAENTRAGQTFENAIRIVSAYMDDPLRSQFEIVLRERSFGVAMPEAIENLARRTKSGDAEMLAATLAVQAQTGGSLSAVLASIGDTVQRRVKIRRTIRAITAEGRFSNYIVFSVPFFLAFMVSAVSPGYLDPLFTNPYGAVFLVAGLVLAIGGLLLSRRLLNMPIY